MNFFRVGVTVATTVCLLWFGGTAKAVVNCPFPQAASITGHGLKPDNSTQAQLNAAVASYYNYWKSKYLAPATKVAGDYKVNFDGKGTTVSEAMGYGMLLTAYMAGADPDAKTCFDGLNRFRKRFPSNVNPALMCWKIPAKENAVSDDGATDGDLDMALALSIPGMTVFAPSSAEEVEPMLRTALELPGPSTIRIPKTTPRHVDPDEVGRGLEARQLRAGDGSVCLLGVGKTVGACLSAADELAAEGIDATVWDARVISPPDVLMLDDAMRHRLVVTAEDGVRHGGAGSFLLDAMAARAQSAGLPEPARRVLGVPRQYLAQGKADDILASLGLDGAGIAETIRRVRIAVPAEPHPD